MKILEPIGAGLKEKSGGVIFWSEQVTDPNTGAAEIVIGRSDFLSFLYTAGFTKIYIGDILNFVRIQDNIIEKSSVDKIQDFVVSYLDNYEDDFTGSQVKEKLLKAINIYFSERFLKSLPTTQLKEQRADKNFSYFYYKNCCVRITQDRKDVIPYSQLSWHVWDTQIIDREFKILDLNKIQDGCVFADYLMCIAQIIYKGSEQLDQEFKDTATQERFNALISIIGYLLHDYKFPDRPCAIVLCDQNLSEEPEGGTGKGLFIRAINHIKKTTIIDGKNFAFGKPFLWQRIGIDTQIVAMEDVEKKFDFEKMFSLITDGWPVEYKNKQEIYFSFEQSPKVLITTNYVIGGRGDSHARRKIEFELSKYFGTHHSPRDEFGHVLFSDWNKDEWNAFDNFMMYCVQFFITNGLIEPKPLLLEQRKYDMEVPQDVTEFLNYFIDIKVNGSFFTVTDILREFKLKYDNYKNLRSDTFGKWVASFIKHSGDTVTLIYKRTSTDRGYYIKK